MGLNKPHVWKEIVHSWENQATQNDAYLIKHTVKLIFDQDTQMY